MGGGGGGGGMPYIIISIGGPGYIIFSVKVLSTSP